MRFYFADYHANVNSSKADQGEAYREKREIKLDNLDKSRWSDTYCRLHFDSKFRIRLLLTRMKWNSARPFVSHGRSSDVD